MGCLFNHLVPLCLNHGYIVIEQEFACRSFFFRFLLLFYKRGHCMTNLNNAPCFGEIPQNYHTFALFDPHQGGCPLMTPVQIP